jgi:hypothetical protein
MTLREFLRRKQRLALIAQGIPVLALVVAVLVTGPQPQPMPRQLYYALSVMIPYCLLYAYTASWPSCPLCGFGLFGLQLRKDKKQHLNFCPHCAAALDERLKESVPRGWP